MRKIGKAEETIPMIDQVDDDEDMNDKDVVDDGPASEESESDDPGIKFDIGFVKTWWEHYIDLPGDCRPVFCPAAGFHDTFHLLREPALVQILWGNSRSNDEHPT